MNRWEPAVNSQMEALTLCHKFIAATEQFKHPVANALVSSTALDARLLKKALPFYWSADVLDAVTQSSRGIPDETKLDRWNLDTSAAWWYFERPLPIQTVKEPEMPIRALSLSWIPGTKGREVFRVSVWVDNYVSNSHVAPSAVFFWEDGETFTEMLTRNRMEHDSAYGSGGRFEGQPQIGVRFEGQPQIGVDLFVAGAAALSRFVLAGLAWMAQRVLVVTDATAERHRRKEWQRTTGSPHPGVRVIDLRRREHEAHTPEHRPGCPTEAGGACDCPRREYHVRWVVDGHWRLAHVGVGRAERRLTWVSPYVKGPDGAPLQVPAGKVYSVTR